MNRYLTLFLLACSLAFANSAQPAQILKVKPLFDFVTKDKPGTPIPWKWTPWTKGCRNDADFRFAGERGAHLIFPRFNQEAREYEAPNRYFKWDSPQDWTDFNFLEVEILNPSMETCRISINVTTVGPPRGAANTVAIPPGKWQKMTIPLAYYENFRVPQDMSKVTSLELLLWTPSIPTEFYIKTMRLISRQPQPRNFDFPGLQAYQFGHPKHPVKTGFQLITSSSPLWKTGQPVAEAPAAKRGPHDPLYDSALRGRKPASLALKVPEDGDYVLCFLMNGSSSHFQDTIISLQNGQTFRHVQGNPYAEYRLAKVTARQKSITVNLKPGRTDAPWSITALAVMKADRAPEIMRDFVWPAYDDLTVQSWSLRAFGNTPDQPPNDPIMAWDIYDPQPKATAHLSTQLGRACFSLFSPRDEFAVSLSLTDLRKPDGTPAKNSGWEIRRAITYARKHGNSFQRVPRFWYPATGDFSLRGGIRHAFMITCTKPEADQTLSGTLRIKGIPGLSQVPVTLTPPPPVDTSKNGMTYFLYYYPLSHRYNFHFRQEQMELKLMKDWGFNSIEVPLMANGIKRNPDGTFLFNYQPMVNFLRKLQKFGPWEGPIPIFIYQPFRWLNLQIAKQPYVWKEEKIQESITGMLQLIRGMEEECKKHQWPPLAYYPFDEFGNPSYVSRFHRAIREMGAMTYTTSVGLYGKGKNVSAQDGIDIYCFPGLKNLEKDFPEMKQTIQKNGGKVWRYSIEGMNPVQERYLWGLNAWQLGFQGYGAWHFSGGIFSVSEMLTNRYFYAYAAFGPNVVMPTSVLYAVRDAMVDRTALMKLQKHPEHRKFLETLKQESEKLGTNPSPKALQEWYLKRGRKQLETMRRLAFGQN